MKEIEILIEVRSAKEDALKALGQFVSQGMKKTLDVYFFDPLRKDLQPNREAKLGRAFRLRQKGEQGSLAYKIDHFDGDMWTYSDEFETGIGDFDTCMEIIKHLGLEELVRIDNEKRVFTTTEYEIVLEDVKGLGLYMEVEKIGEVADDTVEQTKENIRSFLKNLDIEFGEEQNAGKPELMLRKIGN